MQRCQRVIWVDQCRLGKGFWGSLFTITYVFDQSSWGEMVQKGAWDSEVAPFYQDFL